MTKAETKVACCSYAIELFTTLTQNGSVLLLRGVASTNSTLLMDACDTMVFYPEMGLGYAWSNKSV